MRFQSATTIAGITRTRHDNRDRPTDVCARAGKKSVPLETKVARRADYVARQATASFWKWAAIRSIESRFGRIRPVARLDKSLLPHPPIHGPLTLWLESKPLRSLSSAIGVTRVLLRRSAVIVQRRFVY